MTSFNVSTLRCMYFTKVTCIKNKADIWLCYSDKIQPCKLMHIKIDCKIPPPILTKKTNNLIPKHVPNRGYVLIRDAIKAMPNRYWHDTQHCVQ